MDNPPPEPVSPPPDSHYSQSDRLAIALACGSAVVLIALFLAEKTPLVVGLLVALMLGFSIYPILHFTRHKLARVLAVGIVLVVGAIFGSQALRHKPVQGTGAAVTSTKAPETPQPQASPNTTLSQPQQRSQQTPQNLPKKSSPKSRKPSPPAPAPAPQPSFSVINPIGSIVNQGSTNLGNQTVNNFGEPPPKPLVLTNEQGASITTALRQFSGQSVNLETAGAMVDDPFGQRLKDAIEASGLTVNFSSSYILVVQGIGTPPPGISFLFGKNRKDILNALANEIKHLEIVNKPMQAFDLGNGDKEENVFTVFVTPPK